MSILNFFGLYTTSQVHSLIKTSSSATMKGCLRYLKSDNLIIRDKKTKEPIEGAELAQSGSRKGSITECVFKEMRKQGIEISQRS